MQDTQRQSLIGRNRELAQLQGGLADARNGHGGLFLVTGEPGIGKTRLAEELSRHASEDDMLAVWGRCWENPGAPAYWPWTQALRALIEARDPTALKAELGGGADWIAQIVPELRERVPGIEPIGSLRSEQARFALFDAVTHFLWNHSRREPLLIVLDDLHVADRESLALLDFMARSLGDAAVVVMAAYQDAAARERSEAVARQFATLALKGRRVALEGIGEEQVGMMIEAEMGSMPPVELVRELHAITEGNPLFAGEVTRLIAADGQLAAWTAGSAGRLPLPDTVRETIRRRFEPLGMAGVQLLKAAAVIGREFRLGTLERVVAAGSEQIVDVLDQSRAAGLVADVPGSIGRFRFTHGLIRETLYEELRSRERSDLHALAGRALLEVHGDDPEHLAELAHHFVKAAESGGDAERALDYAERAGAEAMRVLAYERAAELFQQAIKVSDLLPRDEERCARLMLSLGTALTRAQDPSAREVLIAAANLARSADRPELLARAALGIHVFNLRPGEPDQDSIKLLDEARERIGPADRELLARLLARIATALYYEPGTAERRNELVTEAVEIARSLEDPATLAYVLINGQLATWGPDTTERDLDWVEELLLLTEEAGNAELALQTRTRQIDYLLELDDLSTADDALAALERTAADSPDPRARAYLPLQRARWSTITGEYAEAEQWNAEAASVGRALDDRMIQLLAVAQLTMMRWTQGRIGEVEELVHSYAVAAPRIVGWRAALARIYCELGREPEAQRELDRLDQTGLSNLPRYNGWMNMMALLAEVCRHLGDERRAAAVYQLLLPFARRNVVTAQCVFDGPVTRFLGILAATTKDWDTAATHFETARIACARMHARPFEALLDIDEARMLASRDGPGDRGRALTLLDRGGRIAGDLGMERIVEQAERMRDGLGEVEPEPFPEPSGPGEPPPVLSASLTRKGDVWAFDFGGRTIHIRDSKGVRCLGTLLSSPGIEIHALQLATSPTPSSRDGIGRDDGLVTGDGGDAGPALDAEAKAAYRDRLEVLLAELHEAESFNDPERAVAAREEMDALAGELAGAVGLHGRDRKAASNAERARVSVTKAIRMTLKRIDEMDADLGQELASTVRTGTFCSYEPHRRRPVTWTVKGD